MKKCPECGAKGTNEVSECNCGYDFQGELGLTKKKGIQQVKVTDIDMPMSSMVPFIIKWTLASIPAMIILSIIFALFYFILSGIGLILF